MHRVPTADLSDTSQTSPAAEDLREEEHWILERAHGPGRISDFERPAMISIHPKERRGRRSAGPGVRWKVPSSATALHPSRFRRDRLVLYIGDQSNQRSLVSRIRGNQQAIRFLQADSARVGLQIAKERQLCLVMMEARLTDDDAAELLVTLRQEAMPVPKPIVVVADDGTPEEHARFIWAGASTYLSDPTDPALVDRTLGLVFDVASWR